jgi:hypothetical protein
MWYCLVMHRRFLLVAVCALLGCAHHRAAPDAPTAGLPQSSGVVVLTGVDLPESGSIFGGHYTGATFDVRQSSYQMTEAVRTRWGRDARQRGEALLRGAGIRVHTLGPSTSDAQQLQGVQYGLSGSVTDLAVRSSGGTEPFRMDVQVEVSWEVLDLGSGDAIFGRTIRAGVREVAALDAAVGHALDASLNRLVADSAFRYALAEMRSDPDAGVAARFARPAPAPDEVVILAPHDINASDDSTSTGRLAAGLVTLHNPDAMLGTAFLISRDGLALTSARIVRNLRRVRARLPNGVDRPIRVVRVARGLDVALIQVACAECTTVDWEAPGGVDVYTNVVAAAAPPSDRDSAGIAFGRVGGRWFLANGVTLVDLPDGVVAGGEPVARTASGKVFAMVSTRPGRRSALLLREVLGALKVMGPGMIP